jgi:hypothetical protein
MTTLADLVAEPAPVTQESNVPTVTAEELVANPEGKAIPVQDDYAGEQFRTSLQDVPATEATPDELIDRPKKGRPSEEERQRRLMAEGWTPPPVVDYKAVATMLFDMTTNSLSTALGPEWMPNTNGTPDEKTVMVSAIEGYMRAKEMPDIPPGMMLTIALVAYSAPRLRAPQTSDKLRKAWLWFRVKVLRR